MIRFINMLMLIVAAVICLVVCADLILMLVALGQIILRAMIA